MKRPPHGGASRKRSGQGLHCGRTDRRSARRSASRTSPTSAGPLRSNRPSGGGWCARRLRSRPDLLARNARRSVIKLSSAATNDDCQRTPDAIGQRAELRDMPVDALAAAAACRELERQNLDLRAVGDQRAPTGIVVFGPPIDMKRRRQPRRPPSPSRPAGSASSHGGCRCAARRSARCSSAW